MSIRLAMKYQALENQLLGKKVSHHTKVDCDSKKQTKTHTQGEGESKCPIVAEWLRSLWSREENCASAIITPQILNQALKVLPI